MSPTLADAYENALRRLSKAVIRVERGWGKPGLQELRALGEFYAAKRALSEARHALESAGVVRHDLGSSVMVRATRTPERKHERAPAVMIGRVRAHLRASGERGGWDRTLTWSAPRITQDEPGSNMTRGPS